ncbi:MAG: hypothetical protein NT015_11465 [Alphaproteobacteria bacterium]|nr:hypothetical protein [Alphaproteobacteria bacterium]
MADEPERPAQAGLHMRFARRWGYTREARVVHFWMIAGLAAIVGVFALLAWAVSNLRH